MLHFEESGSDKFVFRQKKKKIKRGRVKYLPVLLFEENQITNQNAILSSRGTYWNEAL